jgi:hypothetical protein
LAERVKSGAMASGKGTGVFIPGGVQQLED